MQTLQNGLIQGAIFPVYLFSGLRGTGKTTLARLFAKSLNCSQMEGGEPCSQCISCKEMERGASLHCIEIDAASHRGIESIRELNEGALYRSSENKYKVYLIDEVHMLTLPAFNALLKILEEPPDRVVFLLATTEIHKIPATILSRCQKFALKPISLGQIVSHLEWMATKIGRVIEREALEWIAHLSSGALRDAQSFLEQLCTFQSGEISADQVHRLLGTLPSEQLFQLHDALEKGLWNELFALIDQLFSEGKSLFSFIDRFLEYLHQLLWMNLRDDLPKTVLPCEREMLKKRADEYSREALLSLVELIISEREKYRDSRQTRVDFEIFLFSLMQKRQEAPSLSALFSQLQQLEHKWSSSDVELKLKEEEPKREERENEETSVPIEGRERQIYETLLQFASVELEGRIQRGTSHV